ncbi:hypothetical protein QWJ06_02175 [Kocuria rhizophila]|uniref:hypothetical protein n=1 Tax=Kocuria rhizophila TaxID=72000 RepID=UPI001ABE2875|nr:hypothetical protein [Kocuria rhizophila]MBO4145773.1 hypothetical protein [Kocuria rhizophila]MDN3225530.1 hypothetical protein [Kocuria rhizophila]QTK32012.1 hypothetical protein J5U48_02460 [Kocuria rhizophila]
MIGLDVNRLPTGWTLSPLDAVSEVVISNVDKKEYDDQQRVKLCNYTDVYYRDKILDRDDYMPATASQEQINRFTVQSGDVAITKDSETADDIGRPSYAPNNIPGLIYGYHLAIYRPFNKRVGRFMHYIFESLPIRAELQVRTPGVTRVGLSMDTLRNLRVPLPTPELAARIADYLDHETAEIDATIVEQSALIGLVHERQSASIDLAYQEAAQQATQSRPIKYSFRINPTVNKAKRHVPQNSVYLPMSALSEFGKIDTSWSRPTADMMGGYTYIENGDVVVAKVTPCFENGKGAVIADLPDGLGFATTEVTNFRSMGPALAEYLAVIFRTSRFRLGGEAEMTGAGGLRRVPDRYMNNFKIAELNTQKQRRLIERVGEIDRVSHGLVHDLNKAIEFARERRAALITAAVTGQIDVTARNKPASEQLEDDIAQGLHREN